MCSPVTCLISCKDIWKLLNLHLIYSFLFSQWSPTHRQMCPSKWKWDRRQRLESTGVGQSPGRLKTTIISYTMRSNTDLSGPHIFRRRCVQSVISVFKHVFYVGFISSKLCPLLGFMGYTILQRHMCIQSLKFAYALLANQGSPHIYPDGHKRKRHPTCHPFSFTYSEFCPLACNISVWVK